MNNQTTSGGGVGLSGLLGLLFVGLKLTGVIDWSWWWVLLPWYGPLLFIGVLLIVLSILAWRKT